MCGLFGAIITNQPAARAALEKRAETAERMQAHRGPDMRDRRVYELGEKLVLLAHQRLSILDVSEAGRQPMVSVDGHHHIIYNGEVYNYKEISYAHGYNGLKSTSDTEVILRRLSETSPNKALPELNGMWALALLDTQAHKLTLSRDRGGVKPLYYTWVGEDFYFASEIKTLLVLTGKKFAMNRRIVARYIEQSLQDDTNETFFEGIYALPAGSFATFAISDSNLTPVSYWNPFGAAPQGNFRELFMDAVKLRLRSDVPVGVTLSGGLDSSLITHAMKAHLGHADFTVLSAVSPNHLNDESRYIDIMAKTYGLNVTKIELGWKSSDAMSLLAKATWQNDSPLGSFSNVVFYLLMQAAQQHGVKVLLSGQGADEMLCGYKKFLGFYLKHLLRQKRYGKAIMTFAQFAANGSVLNQFSMAEARRYLSPSSRESVLSASTHAAYYPASLGAIGTSLAERQWQDYRHFSVPFLTHYEDRLSMAFGREIRLPYLDYRLVELLLNAPDDLKIRNGWTKWVMRDSFKHDLPSEIIWRKDKQGFVNPQADWLKNELRAEVEQRFADGANIYGYDLIDAEKLRARYRAYCAGKSGIWYRDIFNPLGLEIWLEQYREFLI